MARNLHIDDEADASDYVSDNEEQHTRDSDINDMGSIRDLINDGDGTSTNKSTDGLNDTSDEDYVIDAPIHHASPLTDTSFTMSTDLENASWVKTLLNGDYSSSLWTPMAIACANEFGSLDFEIPFKRQSKVKLDLPFNKTTGMYNCLEGTRLRDVKSMFLDPRVNAYRDKFAFVKRDYDGKRYW